MVIRRKVRLGRRIFRLCPVFRVWAVVRVRGLSWRWYRMSRVGLGIRGVRVCRRIRRVGRWRRVPRVGGCLIGRTCRRG